MVNSHIITGLVSFYRTTTRCGASVTTPEAFTHQFRRVARTHIMHSISFCSQVEWVFTCHRVLALHRSCAVCICRLLCNSVSCVHVCVWWGTWCNFRREKCMKKKKMKKSVNHDSCSLRGIKNLRKGELNGIKNGWVGCYSLHPSLKQQVFMVY